MNFFDIAIIIIISFCLIRGAFKGLIREVAGIVGVIAGFYGAYTYYKVIGPLFHQWISTPAYQNLIAFFLLFCLILIGVSLISTLIRKFLNLVFLGWVDRLFGLVFGVLKGILIVSILFIMITTFLPDHSAILSQSVFAPYVAEISRVITLFVSKNFRSDFLLELERVKQLWNQ